MSSITTVASTGCCCAVMEDAVPILRFTLQFAPTYLGRAFWLTTKRNVNRDLRSTPGFRKNLPTTAEPPDALLHAGETVPLSVSCRRQPLAIVANEQE